MNAEKIKEFLLKEQIFNAYAQDFRAHFYQLAVRYIKAVAGIDVEGSWWNLKADVRNTTDGLILYIDAERNDGYSGIEELNYRPWYEEITADNFFENIEAEKAEKKRLEDEENAQLQREKEERAATKRYNDYLKLKKEFEKYV